MAICYHIAMPDIIPITMFRDNLDHIPQHQLPAGFSIRNFRRGEGELWAQIGADAGGFGSFDEGMARFDAEFAFQIDEMESRCFFIIDDTTSHAVGTAMAWFDPDFNGELCGRVHWVAIIPEYQGKGLAKPLITAVLNRMAESHDCAVLGTQTFRWKAVKLYLDFGFKPYFMHPTCPEAWRELLSRFNLPDMGS